MSVKINFSAKSREIKAANNGGQSIDNVLALPTREQMDKSCHKNPYADVKTAQDFYKHHP